MTKFEVCLESGDKREEKILCSLDDCSFLNLLCLKIVLQAPFSPFLAWKIRETKKNPCFIESKDSGFPFLLQN